MTPPAAPTKSFPNLVTIRGPQGLLAAVPFLLGFTPVESLLLLCLNGERSRVGPVVRVDLPRGRDAEVATAEYLAVQAGRHAEAVLLVCYTTPRRRGRPASTHPRAGLMRRCRAAAQQAGVTVLDLLLVEGDHSWSYLNDRPGDQGRRVPGPLDDRLAELRCAFAVSGREVVGQREDLRRIVAGPTDADPELIAEFESAPERLATMATGLLPDEAAEVRRLVVAGAMSLLQQAHRLHRSLPNRAVADLVTAIDDRTTRDWLLQWILGQDHDDVLPLVLSLARAVPDPLAAEISVVASWTAYRSGDGALANVAVERALAIDPDHVLAGLLLRCFFAGMRPEELDRLLDDAGVPPTPGVSA